MEAITITFDRWDTSTEFETEATFILKSRDWDAAQAFVNECFVLLDGDAFEVEPLTDVSGGIRWEHPTYVVTARPSTLVEIPPKEF